MISLEVAVVVPEFVTVDEAVVVAVVVTSTVAGVIPPLRNPPPHMQHAWSPEYMSFANFLLPTMRS